MKSDEIAKEMQLTYDRYFSSKGYRRRYPRPNAATLDFVLAHGARDAERILDFGCGNGRYSLALLDHSRAHVTAYDISAPPLEEFEHRLKGTPNRARVTFVVGDRDRLAQMGPYDLVLMLFGVLSHLGGRATRIETLRRLREWMREDGRLILSVPSIFRRRPRELLECALARHLGDAKPPLDEGGNIYFTREVGGDRLTFFYHLYTLRELRDELAAAGFSMDRCEAESLLPEWVVTSSDWLSRLDRKLSDRVPPQFGYGMRVLATAV